MIYLNGHIQREIEGLTPSPNILWTTAIISKMQKYLIKNKYLGQR